LEEPFLLGGGAVKLIFASIYWVATNWLSEKNEEKSFKVTLYQNSLSKYK
jgi:hypothetical protein